MTTDELITSEPAEPPEPYRPVKADRGPGLWLRRLTGVDERILDWVPEERPRYTRQGAIVLNAGLLAALSMYVVLSELSGALIAVPGAMLFGLVILSFQSWMSSAARGRVPAARSTGLLPQLLLSLLLGWVVAEPLLLWVFQPSLHAEVALQREAQDETYVARLRACNPIDGSLNKDAQCGSYYLPVATSLPVLQESVRAAAAQRDAIQRQVAGMSQTDPDVAQMRDQLTAQNKILADLDAKRVAEAASYADRISIEIRERLDDRRASRPRIGVLEEEAALGRLAGASPFVLTMQWLLRSLLILLYALPVLTKLLEGVTTYDRLHRRQLQLAARLQELRESQRERRELARTQVEIADREYRERRDHEQLEEKDRMARAQHEADLNEQIEALADRLAASSKPQVSVRSS
ncbi:DUF4407 domain-containing protein [Dactylosporangium sp. CS-033363]|uniref:DUF4407 domain-containing protein n=1 Tax=Dactylosporangium sp. CS-033363 TaxID=3239935 RepID=UPI003D8DA5BF